MCENSVTMVKKINKNNAVTFNQEELKAASAEYMDLVQVTIQVIKKPIRG